MHFEECSVCKREVFDHEIGIDGRCPECAEGL